MATATLDPAPAGAAADDDGVRFAAGLRQWERRLGRRARIAALGVGVGLGALAAGGGWLGHVAFAQGRLGRGACVSFVATLAALCRRGPRGLMVARIADERSRRDARAREGRPADDAILAAADLLARAERPVVPGEGDLRPLAWQRGLARLHACEHAERTTSDARPRLRLLLALGFAGVVLALPPRSAEHPAAPASHELARELSALVRRANDADDRVAADVARALLAAMISNNADASSPDRVALAAQAERLWQEHQAALAALAPLAALRGEDAHLTGARSSARRGPSPSPAPEARGTAEPVTPWAAGVSAAVAPNERAPDDPAGLSGAAVGSASPLAQTRETEATRRLARLRRDLDDAARVCGRDAQACQRAEARTRDDEANLRKEAGDGPVRRSLADAARRVASASSLRSPPPVEANAMSPRRDSSPGRAPSPSDAEPAAVAPSRRAAVAPTAQTLPRATAERRTSPYGKDMTRVGEETEPLDQAGRLTAGGSGLRAGDALPPEAVAAEHRFAEAGRLAALPAASGVAGVSRARTIEGAAARGTDEPDYPRVYAAYREAATRAMGDTHVGREHRALVERYFEAIRPRRASR